MTVEQPTLFPAGPGKPGGAGGSAGPPPRPRPQADAGPRYTPYELSELLRQRHRPTAEQAAIISAPVEPLLVVAGAGSGKTETMAARVVWLVANGYASPERILGLTFTRKAAGELAHRVRTRLGQLVRRLGRDSRHPEDDMIGGEPTVATYHSYAARIVTEHGLRSGYEPAARLLTEASRWQLVDTLVRNYTGDLSELDRSPATVTSDILSLAGELAEHLVTPDELAAWTGRFHAEVSSRPGRMYKSAAEALNYQRMRLALLPLVREYERRKQDLEALDFGDQLARAARVASDHPEVGMIERDRYRIVLLDEYQDTSHAQVVLLRAMFGGGHPVTAVGDPCQSIYGWRGASAGTLDRFPTEFPRRDDRPAQVRKLTTSWRNRPEVLTVANAISAPLRAAGARVTELRAAGETQPFGGRTARGARAGTVHCALLETYLDEAEWIADGVVAAWRTAAAAAAAAQGVQWPGGDAEPRPEDIPVRVRPTTAVLVRVRHQIAPIEAALRARGVPVEVVGLGGLLDTPEVRDVVCTLRVLADPTDGPALLRLLTGARWRIGPRDLVALHRRAREIAQNQPDDATLVEALADLGAPEAYSDQGYRRLSRYGRELESLRQRLDQPLPDVISDVERTIGLDVEVAVRAGMAANTATAGEVALARGHLDALGEVAARFAGEADGATLPAFLAYLAAAEAEERGLTPGEVDVVTGAVQILTAHAAKGLEWDVVAVAGLTEKVWPGVVRASDHYLRGVGVLPFPLRGDRASLPYLDLSDAADGKAVDAAFKDFVGQWRHHDEREERRLAYVAVTRPRRLLLCSGYWWGEGIRKPRGPSVFLREVYERCVEGAGVIDAWTPQPDQDAENPTIVALGRTSWPADPLGSRRPALTEAADLVRQAIREIADGDEVIAGGGAAGDDDQLWWDEAERWRHEATLLLAERERGAHRDGPTPVILPGHLSVSQLVALRRDPAAFARTLRRPLPARPAPYARRGTAFHAWLEQRFGADRLLDVDELPGAADSDAAGDEAFAELRRRFLSSRWADRTPMEVEVPFATVIGGVVIRGRMDAVFADPGGRFDVVDWKTGRLPTGAAASVAAVQLAAYRLAWAALADVPVERVRAAFHYVREDVTVRPADLLDAEGLTALITALPLAQDG